MSRLEPITFTSREVIRSYLKSGTRIYIGDEYWHSFDGRIVICYSVEDDKSVGHEDMKDALDIIYKADDTMVDLD